MLAQARFDIGSIKIRCGWHRAFATLQSCSKPEGAAFARRTHGPDFATHELRQAAGDRQAEAGAAKGPCRRHIGLLERVEHLAKRF